MRDVFIDEIETDDTDAYVRNKFKDKQITFEKTVLENGNDYLRYQCLRDKREAFLYGNLDHSEGKTEQNRRKNMTEELMKCLEEQQVDARLLKEIRKFRDRYPVARETANRIVPPLIPFFGKEIFEMAAYGLLEGENILLTGTKATGKNVLAENLAYLFGRPLYNISFHVNTDSSTLIGHGYLPQQRGDAADGTGVMSAQ